ncbi:MAG: succinylglutamate desuccinylase/aspartoacylase family protein [Geminicoccaceae bacterium]
MATTDVIQIREMRGEAGRKVRGFVTVGESPGGPIRIPIMLITGTRPGPTLGLSAGVHATEYPAIDAVMRTIQALDPAVLSGTVIAAPVVNQLMYQTRTPFISPVDGQNLNRMAPGRPDGTISEILAYVLLEELVLKADVHIDCHGGDMGEILWPYAGYALSGNAEQDRRGEALARLYTPRIFALYQDGTPLPPTNGAITANASRRGTIGILGESGSNGRLDEQDVQVHLRGIANVMRHLGMVPGKPAIEGDRLRARGQFVVAARRGGLLRVAIEIGQEIEAGQEIAQIVDPFGEVVERVRAEQAGIARLIWAHKAVNTGDPIVKCWQAEPAAPFDFDA